MFPTVKRVVAAGLTAVVVLGGAASAFAAEIRNVGERTFRFVPGGEVTIESQNGRIVIEAWDKPQIRVQITRTVRAGDEARARELMRGLRADVEVRSDRLHIQSRYPKIRENLGIWDILGGRVAALQVHYYLQVPRNTSPPLHPEPGCRGAPRFHPQDQMDWSSAARSLRVPHSCSVSTPASRGRTRSARCRPGSHQGSCRSPSDNPGGANPLARA